MSSLKDEIFSIIGGVIDSWGWADKIASNVIVNKVVGSTRNRPHPWSTASDYTSWKGLTDRTYLARQLPAAKADFALGQPSTAEVMTLFARPAGGQRMSSKSTCLFPAFAQYLTDGFLRTDADARERTTSSHEIDLCQLYGRNEPQTKALRLRTEDVGKKGRLKSQTIDGEEYPPFLYLPGTTQIDPQFDILDRPLGTFHKAKTTTTTSATATQFTTMTVKEFITLPGVPLPPIDHASIFAIGGDRANSTPFTAMMNTLFLGEHNRIAGVLEDDNPEWNDEQVFQTARNIMIPIFIKIVVEQYINHITPAPFSLVADPSVAWDAHWNRPNFMTAEFSLLYRWHSLLPDTIAWPGRDPDIPLIEFTLDNRPLLEVGLAKAFEAAASQSAAELGAFNTDASLMRVEHLAIDQARYNHIASYNDYRESYGMDRAEDFSDISSNPAVAAKLEELYTTVDKVEFYPGLFAEDLTDKSPLPGLLMRMVAVDAFSQAFTNPLLSEHVWNEQSFTEWGFELIAATSSLGDLLKRQGTLADGNKITMTQPSWRYGWHRP